MILTTQYHSAGLLLVMCTCPLGGSIIRDTIKNRKGKNTHDLSL